MPEIAGDAALYADPFNITDISEKMKSLESNPELRSKLIEAGKEQVKRFDWDKSEEQLWQLFKNVAKS